MRTGVPAEPFRLRGWAFAILVLAIAVLGVLVTTVTGTPTDTLTLAWKSGDRLWGLFLALLAGAFVDRFWFTWLSVRSVVWGQDKWHLVPDIIRAAVVLFWGAIICTIIYTVMMRV